MAAAARELGLRGGRARARGDRGAGRGARWTQPAGRADRAAAEVRREHPFAFALGAGSQPLVTGVIDLLAREADGRAAGGRLQERPASQARSRCEELVERDYGVQRLLYALAVLRDGALAVEVVHWFLERPAESVAARFTAAPSARRSKSGSARLAWRDWAGRLRGQPAAPSRPVPDLSGARRAVLLGETRDDARAARRRAGGRRPGAARRLSRRGCGRLPSSSRFRALCAATLSGSASGARLPAHAGRPRRHCRSPREHRPKGALP